ncbi:histidine phosphatase family protein [Candidatus Neomarinimicrobiota bacterium]
MKNLLLMRHGAAHSAPSSKQRDHDRPLSPHGREEVLAIAKYLAHIGTIPDIILTSSATRCIQTGETIVKSLDYSGGVQSRSELYLASPETYLTAVRQLHDEWSTALIIGHNPAVQEFAHAIQNKGVAPGSFVSASITCISLAISSWKMTALHTGNCLWFTKPGESGFLH